MAAFRGVLVMRRWRRATVFVLLVGAVGAASAGIRAVALEPRDASTAQTPALTAVPNGEIVDPGRDERIEVALTGVKATDAGKAKPTFSARGLRAMPTVAAAITVSQDAGRAMCIGSFVQKRSDDAAVAAQIMAGKLPLPNHRTAPLASNPTWREDPYADANWRFQYHNLYWVDRLRRVGSATGNQAMLARWKFLLQDWLHDVPPGRSAPSMSWLDMAVGMRAVFLSCAIGELGPLDWLTAAVASHGVALSDPKQYAGIGNHAMHQNNGLLAMGQVAGRSDWTRLALDRNDKLLGRAVDAQGVIDEGALGYQWTNFVWWNDAKARVLAAGLRPSPLYARVGLMLDLVAYGAAPDAIPEIIGDTSYARSGYVRGTASEYAATQGRSGPVPPHLTRVYRAGYAIGRSGWGRTRPFGTETFWTMRFGPPLSGQVHGHQDHGAITLASYGSRLLWDQGLYAFYGGAMRAYVRSPQAHNGVTVDGAAFDPNGTAPLVAYKDTPAFTLTSVEVRSFKGIRWIRTFFYSKRGRYLLVDDRIAQVGGSRPRTAVQRFHLGPDRAVAVKAGTIAATSGPGANVGVFWVGPPVKLRVVKGQSSPLMGWRSLEYRKAFKVPVVEARTTGTSMRFTSVIIPRPAGAAAGSIRVAAGSRTAGAATVTVYAGQVVERVTVQVKNAWVTKIR
jgi:Heparinase II/III-like protein/Heparinase II/III N-terminus